MRRARVYGCDADVAARLVTLLADLGYTPERPTGRTAADVASDSAGAPEPDVLVVAAGPASIDVAEGLATTLRAVPELARVPLVFATAPPVLSMLGDELVVMPAGAEELATRIARARANLGIAPAGNQIQVGGLELDLATYEATVDGRPARLTHMEYELLRFLATHPGQVFSRPALLERVWGYDYYGATRTVDVHVRRVRAKLGTEHAARIHTVRSVGYRFDR